HRELRTYPFWLELQQTIRDMSTKIDRRTAAAVAEITPIATTGASIVDDSITVGVASSDSGEVDRRRKLLEEFIGATGVHIYTRIYGPADVHKAEFQKWRKGTLPRHSKRAKRLEGFLAAKKVTPRRPLP